MKRPEGQRTQSDLNRAASTHYYALFHELAEACATFMIGPKPQGHGRRAWKQVYRALEHKTCKANCKKKDILEKFLSDIKDFANHFVRMQEQRHQSDYDPLAQVTVGEIEFEILTTRAVLAAFRSTPEIDRRAFCAFVLFRNRENPLRSAAEQPKVKLGKKPKKPA